MVLHWAKVSPKTALPQAKWSELSQPPLERQVFQGFSCLNGLSWWFFSSISMSLLYWNGQHWCQHARCVSPVLSKAQFSQYLVKLDKLPVYLVDTSSVSRKMLWRHLSKPRLGHLHVNLSGQGVEKHVFCSFGRKAEKAVRVGMLCFHLGSWTLEGNNSVHCVYERYH